MSRIRVRPHPFEVAAVASCAAGVGWLWWLGLPIAGAGLSRTASLAVTLGGFGAVVGVGLQWMARRFGGRGAADYGASLRDPSWWGLWLRLWLACIAVSFVYFWVKVYVPISNPGSHDAAIWGLERTLHFGVAPSAILRRLVQAPALLRAIDVWYGLWLLTLGCGLAFFAAEPRSIDRKAFMLSCLLLWSAGAALYTAVPVLGPVYAFPGLWRDLPSELPLAATTQARLGANLERVREGARAGHDGFDYTRGVAALPSLHVGFHALFALWLRALWPRAFPLALVLTGLTLVGSVRTGWHYAVDGYVGVGLAALVFWTARRLESESAAC